MKPKKKRPPDLLAVINAGLSAPIALEACLRQVVNGRRMGHWSHRHGLHQTAVTAVLRGRRTDRTVIQAIAFDLHVSPELVKDLLEPIREQWQILQATGRRLSS